MRRLRLILLNLTLLFAGTFVLRNPKQTVSYKKYCSAAIAGSCRMFCEIRIPSACKLFIPGLTGMSTTILRSGTIISIQIRDSISTPPPRLSYRLPCFHWKNLIDCMYRGSLNILRCKSTVIIPGRRRYIMTVHQKRASPL